MVSFGQPFTQYWPEDFPYGRSSVPVIAPYWNDLDFRNDIEGSGVFYSTHTSSGTKLDANFLKVVSDRLASYSDSELNFEPKWMMVATWNNATPYYGRYNREEVSL